MQCTDDISKCDSITKDFSKGALVWYDFRQDCEILYLYSETKNSAIIELLKDKGEVEVCSILSYKYKLDSDNESDYKKYDYIVSIDIIEECEIVSELLEYCHKHLKQGGKLLIGAENRYGIKYICGDRDPYTNHSFDGIENYRRITDADMNDIKGRCYSKVELDNMLSAAGFNNKFYSVMPSLEETQLVYSEDYTPFEELSMRYFPLYNHPESVFLDEQYLYTDLIKNGLFHTMANAYIIESSVKDGYSFEMYSKSGGRVNIGDDNNNSYNCCYNCDSENIAKLNKESSKKHNNNILHATISMDRGRENAVVTVICENNGESGNKINHEISSIKAETNCNINNKSKIVYKQPVYPDGIHKLKAMQDNLDDLHSRGINVVNSYIEGDKFIMPYIDKPVAMIKLKEIAKKDKNAFIQAMDTMYELILASSEHTDIISEKEKNSANGRDLGVILSKGYIDMVPLNCFYNEAAKTEKDRFIYYDQEFYWENCPANVIMYRSISIIYDGTDKQFERIVPRREMMERYQLTECEDIWCRLASRFTTELRNQEELTPFYNKKRTDPAVVYTNREKVNYSDKEYNDIFVNIFDGIEKLSTNGNKKKVLLFGSGNYSKRFLAQFAGQYEVYSIIDNNESKWGTELEGIPINSPDIIKSIGVDDIYFIICIKKYYGVVNQLRKLGVEEYHIYDPGRDYPNKRRENILARLNKRYQNDIHVGDENRQSLAGINILDNKSPRVSGQPDMSKDLEEVDKSEATVVSKPYNIGYIAGVFDLFHIGHLNMFKRAKEMCNYLIVGVVSDEGVRLNKQAEPFVPFEERIEMVRSCRYVDEAVKLPLDFAGTRDMFKVYHFDVQFSGSDYEHNTYWLEEKKFLEENGSTMVFFPYTQSTSSTKLKKAIESRISGVN